MFVVGTSVPLIPCFLGGRFEACPPHAKIPRPLPVAASFGKLRTFESITNESEGWAEIATTLETSVKQLAEAHAPDLSANADRLKK